MKRFYKAAEAKAGEGGHQVLLDGRMLRTPAKAPLVLPSAALAEAVAAEWRAQGEKIEPATMPMMTLASTAIDRVTTQRERVIDEIAGYAASDLVCYRADEPAELAARQHAVWQPLLDWCALEFDALLGTTSGVMPLSQPPEALAALRAAVARYDDMTLAAHHQLTSGFGSLVISLAVLEGRIDAEAGFAASQIDESFQSERWGEDAEAAARRERLRKEMLEAARFVTLCRE